MQHTVKLVFVLTVLVLSIGIGDAGGEAEMGAWSDRVPRVRGVRQHFVGPDGKTENPGTRQAPWDLASALAARQKVPPGDIIWVRGGTYKGKFEVKVAGKDGAPVHVRAYPGERTTILDSGMTVVAPASYVWLWDLEITCSVPVEKRETKQTGSHPTDLPGADGLNVYTGKGCKYINLVIHDNVGSGVGWWVGSTESEFHGCLIYGNGWRAPDRGHGHCIYAQNREGVKTISSCIMSVPYNGCYTMHAYGSSRAYVDNFLIEDNIACEKGPFLVGGGRPSHNIKILRNYLHGINMRIGYGAQNEDCEVRGNVIANGTLTIEKFHEVVDEENIKQLPDQKAVLIPNKYNPNRAHLVVYNGAKLPAVQVGIAPFLQPGDTFRLMDPKDFFGTPIIEGRCEGPEITVPMTGEFAPFVMVKEKGQ